MRASTWLVVSLAIALGCGCGDDGAPVDGGGDGSTRDAGAPSDAGTVDAATLEDGGLDASVTSDAGPSCLDDGHAAGDRFPAGDGCNFCDCLADGTRACTERACRIPSPGQEAFDIEVLVEWITADGAFDEGFHT